VKEIDQMRKRLETLNRLALSSLGLRSFEGLGERDYGFFPGGNGLVDGRQAITFPWSGTLILGSNFGSTTMLGIQNEWKTQDERSGATWSRLRKRLKEAGIGERNCFFTNAWPFLHIGGSNVSRMIGHWLSNERLTSECVGFFKETLAEMSPRLIIALGMGPAAFLSWVWPECLMAWRQRSWELIDQSPPIVNVGHHDHPIVCAVITHPSMPNSRYRRGEYSNVQGEVELLAKAARAAGVSILNTPA
jgi:hypothetical protein